jgi:hypothetical protein
MPFNFKEYREWCRTWDDDILQEEYQKYVRATARGSTGTAVGYGLAFFTFGLSLIGAAASGATLANAAAKVDIIRTEMARRKRKHKLETRPLDVFRGIALGSLSLVSTPIEHVVGPALTHATSSGATYYHGTPYVPRVEER